VRTSPCLCVRPFSNSVRHFLTWRTFITPSPFSFTSWRRISMEETYFAHKTESHHVLLCGSKFPMSLPLHINWAPEQHLTDWLTDWLTDGLLCHLLHVNPTISATPYREIKCSGNTERYRVGTYTLSDMPRACFCFKRGKIAFRRHTVSLHVSYDPHIEPQTKWTALRLLRGTNCYIRRVTTCLHSILKFFSRLSWWWSQMVANALNADILVRIPSSGVWGCVVGRVVPDVSRQRGTFIVEI
jgi:hypothetical protein